MCVVVVQSERNDNKQRWVPLEEGKKTQFYVLWVWYNDE